MNRFKVGDKVRYKSENGPWFEYQITDGDVGVVVGNGFNEDKVMVNFGVSDYVYIDDLELVAPADPKREFLERLQSLLREFDAHINSDFNQSDEINTMTLVIGTDTVCYSCTDNLTADNIMDFNKE